MAKGDVQSVEEQEVEGAGDSVAAHGEKRAADYQPEVDEREKMEEVVDTSFVCED